MKVKIKRVGSHELPPPKYETKGAAGADLRASPESTPMLNRTDDGKGWILLSGATASFSCGFAFAVPEGYELQIRGRSGLATKGIVVVGGVGTVDSDFRADPQVRLWNTGGQSFVIREGDRIAQAVIAPVIQADFEDVRGGELDQTERGTGGHGSTGLR